MAKDPTREFLDQTLRSLRGDSAAQAAAAAEAPRRGKSISPKLVTLSALLHGENDHQLVRVVAPEWAVEAQVLNETPKNDLDDQGQVLARGIVGYETVFGPVAVSQCQPDVLGALRDKGIEGDVKLVFKSRVGDPEEFPVFATITQAPMAEPRAISPNAGLPEMMAMFMAQQERQSQMLLAAVAKMTEKTAAADRDWQRKLEEQSQRHAQQMQDQINRQAAQFQGDKRLQIGGTIEQAFLQATNAAVERTFGNMLNPQPAPQQQGVPMPGMGMATTPTQMMAQMVQGMKADAEAKRVIAQELPGLLGEATKAPEPTLFEYAQQLIPMFMLLKNMNGKDPNQLENAMKQFAMMRQGPAANVNPITGMPIPDAAPADGEAALAQLTANLG